MRRARALMSHGFPHLSPLSKPPISQHETLFGTLALTSQLMYRGTLCMLISRILLRRWMWVYEDAPLLSLFAL